MYGEKPEVIMRIQPILLSTVLATVAALAEPASGVTLYSTDFNVDDTPNWTVNNGPGDAVVDFFYDYSAIGVPAAPNGTGTRGLKMTANNSSGLFTGVTVSPTGQNFTGVFNISFDIWQNYAGPLGAGGSGSTQFSQYGLGTTGTTSQWIGSATKDGVSFGTTLDGGSASDYRIYSPTAPSSYPSGNFRYLAPSHSTNNSDPYYTTAFPAIAGAPAAQIALYPGQTGATDAGETSFKWRRVVIDVNGNFAHWSIDGVNLGLINLADFGGWSGNIFFGHSDTNATSSSDPNRVALNVTLIDNVLVTGIPEPSSMILCILGGMGGLALRRKR
jgi:hypothetical protein